MVWLVTIAAVAAAYLIGSVNSSIIISKLIGTDIRGHGSGNAGATNMLRTYGKRVGVLTLLCDVLKGILAVGIAFLIMYLISAYFPFYEDDMAVTLMPYLCGIAVVVGHNYPIFFQFKGGKGIATSAAVIFMLDWRLGLFVLASALLVMVLTRYISLGSIFGGIVFPVSAIIFTILIDKDYNYALILTAVIMGVLAIYRHHANISRLMYGTESRLGAKKKANKEEETH